MAFDDNLNSAKMSVMKYDFPTGLNEHQEPGLTLYPNPVTTHLNIILSKTGDKINIIEVQDIRGKIMSFFKTSEDKFILNTQDYPTGIYILKVKTEKSNYIGKFCKD